jgi:hypothetical protein
MWGGRVVLGCLAAFWCLVLLVGAAHPGYNQTRDYVSTLAARGADYGWLGMVAICAAALALLATATLLRTLSRLAAVLTGIAGIGFLVVAFTRLSCPNGPAGCGLGGRFDVSGFREITHSAATTVSAVSLVAAMACSGSSSIGVGARARALRASVPPQPPPSPSSRRAAPPPAGSSGSAFSSPPAGWRPSRSRRFAVGRPSSACRRGGLSRWQDAAQWTGGARAGGCPRPSWRARCWPRWRPTPVAAP